MNRFLILLLCLGSFAVTKAQNAAPVISNLTTTHNSAANTVTFDFDLSDAEGDDCDVQLRVSGDNGRTWLITTANVTGDQGFPQTPGTGKSMLARLLPGILPPASTQEILQTAAINSLRSKPPPAGGEPRLPAPIGWRLRLRVRR